MNVILYRNLDAATIGALRAELLASGRAREAVLYPADLGGDFWLGNALRGLIPVRLRPA